MTNETLQPPSTGATARFPDVNDTAHPDGQGYQRRDFLKIVGASAGAAPGVLATTPKAPATVIPSDREMRILAAAANRGDAAAKARLSAIGQAMLARDEAQPAKR